MKKKETRRNIFRAIPLSLSDNKLCLKFLLMAQKSITVYFYGSMCVTHTLLLCMCLCDKHLHTVPYKRGCKNPWITCSFKVSFCFLRSQLFNVFIDFISFNFFWWTGISIWRFTSASQETTHEQTLKRNSPGVLQIQDIILPNLSWIDFYR